MSFLIESECIWLRMAGVQKNVLMQLAQLSNDHGYSWPSITYLCVRTDWSRSAVIEALNFLEAEKVIVRDKVSGRSTGYWVRPGNWTGPRHEKPGADPSSMRTSPRGGLVQILDPTRPGAGPHPSTTRTLIPLNTIESIPPNPPRGAAAGFPEFFAIFPKQVDEEKARNQWDLLAPDDALRAAIMASVLEWRTSLQWLKDGGIRIPKPHNWLRNKGWCNVPGIAPLPRKPAPPEEPKALAAPMPESVKAYRRSLKRTLPSSPAAQVYN